MKQNAATTYMTPLQRTVSTKMLSTDIWILIADIINDPVLFERCATVSKQFHSIFTSDRVWRFYNVEGWDSGFRDKFIESSELKRWNLFVTGMYPFEPDLTTKARKLLYYQFKHMIPLEMGKADPQFQRCLINTVRPKTVYLPPNRELSLDILNRCHSEAKVMSFPNELEKDKEVILRVLELKSPLFPQLLTFPKEWCSDKEFMMIAMANSCQFAQIASADLLADTEMLRELVVNNIGMLKYAPEYLRHEFEFLKTCNFQQQPWGFRYAADHIRSDRSLLKILLVKICGTDSAKMAKYLTMWSLRRNDAMMISFELFHELHRPSNWVHPYGLDENLWKIVDEYPQCYIYASPHMQNKINFLFKAVALDGMLLEHAPKCLQVCRRVIRRATRTNRDAIQFVPRSHHLYAWPNVY